MKSPFALPVVGLIALALAGPPPAVAADQMSIRPADQIQWAAAPPVLPPGAKIAVLSGDPFREGHFVIRLQFPPNYEVAAHNHPATEYLTVLEGSFGMGHGDVLDRGAGQELRAGGFVVMPAGQNHFGWAGAQGATIEIHMQGPFALRYVDPSKDPQRGATGVPAR
jgi:quercetin dioxygenase-like cupin family protein